MWIFANHFTNVWALIMNDLWECVICGTPLTQEKSTSEHIIPNALGGQLRTRNAICQDCNSKTGHEIDTELIESLSMFANVFDVPRDRGKHPDLYLKDETTGLEYKFQPGKQVVRAPNIRVSRNDGEIGFNFFAPTREDAERIVRKNLPKNKNLVQTSSLVGEPVEKNEYSITQNVQFNNINLLRAIAKIASCYVRYKGIQLPSLALAPSFVLNGTTGIVPVTTPHSDIVQIVDLPEHPLYHAIFLHKAQNSPNLFAYIVLFQAFEFIVLVDHSSELPPVTYGYLWNIVTGFPESHDFSWIACNDEMLAWFGQQVLSEAGAERLRTRHDSIAYWAKHSQSMWLQRAITAAANEYYRCKDAGESHEAAQAVAQDRMDKILAPHDLKVENFRIE
jgi:HNH endonuclease